jgi:hypothetical protein
MAGPSKVMRVSGEEVLCAQSDVSESGYSSDSEINAKTSSGGEQSVSSDKAENIGDNRSMQPEVWAKSGAERPHFPFTGQAGINVTPRNILSCFVHQTLRK